MSWWGLRTAMVVAACGGLAGCSSEPAQQAIAGTVELDGRPVKTGHIRFAPFDSRTSSAEVFIKDGKYTAKLMTGSYKVEIYSPRAKGKPAKRIPGPGADADEFDESIPARYNIKTVLKADIVKEKKEYHFTLDSK